MAGIHYNLVRNSGFPPSGAVQLACQTDGGGPQWNAVAHTQWGDIPGKAKNGNCWFSYFGKEHMTNSFSWIMPATQASMVLVMNNGSGPPPKALRVGHQTDGAGPLYAAVANSNWGGVPGKAKDNTCWFPFNGAEHETGSFYWVCHQ